MMSKSQTQLQPQFLEQQQQQQILRRRHAELARSVDHLSNQKADEFPQHAGLQEIHDLLKDIGCSLKQARREGDSAFLVWANEIAGYWQSVMTSVFAIPIDVRDTLGIQLEDTARRVRAEPVRITEYLNDQAYRIGASRKLLVLLRQLEFYSAQPDRIHNGIPSTKEECDSDWYQACMYFALNVLLGRIPFRSIAADPEALDYLDKVFIDDLVKLEAYLLWEQSHTRSSPDCSSSFYFVAEERVVERISPSQNCDPLLGRTISEWFRLRLLPNATATTEREQRRERKTRRLVQECRLVESDAVGIASAQQNLFESNIVRAIQENCPPTIQALIASTTGREQPLYRHCTTALEAIVVSCCIPAEQ